MCSCDHHTGDIIILQTDIEATFHRGNQTPPSITSLKDAAEVKSQHTFCILIRAALSRVLVPSHEILSDVKLLLRPHL